MKIGFKKAQQYIVLTANYFKPSFLREEYQSELHIKDKCVNTLIKPCPA